LKYAGSDGPAQSDLVAADRTKDRKGADTDLYLRLD
jgi:hypothetical protein